VWFAGLIAEIRVTDGGAAADTAPMGDRDLWAAAKPNYLSDLRGATPDQTFAVEFGDPEISFSVEFIAASVVAGLCSCACCGLVACACKARCRPASPAREVPPAVAPGSADEAPAGRPFCKSFRVVGVVIVGVFFLVSAAIWTVFAMHELPGLEGEAVNGEVYTGEVMVEMKVNQVQEWTLRGAAHPFHIHTNHFQLISHGSDDLWTVGDWFDTVPADGVIRFYTDTFTGTLVLHCHRLEHEDQGMMAKVVIVP